MSSNSKINKFKIFNTYLLKWDVIHYIYNSFIGKVLIFLSIVSAMLSMSFVSGQYFKGLFFLSFSVLIFILGYIIYILFIPHIIQDFTRYDFIQNILDRNEKKQLSKITEFSFLENEKLEKLPIYIDNVDNFNRIRSIDILEDNTIDTVYQLAQIKFDYINNSFIAVRTIITLLLLSFFVTFYFVTIERIINYLLQFN